MSSHLPSVTTPPLAARLAAAEAARQAKESERDRDLHPAVVSALSEAGFLRQFVPRRWSGSAGTFAEIIEAVAVVGEECPSAAWCAALLAAHGRLAAHLPQEAQEELWQESPDVSIAAAVVPPSGELAKAPGGWRLSGRWAMASAVRHARWVLLACVEETPEGPRQRILAVPRADVRIHDTWRNAGLRGTGSHTISVDGAFVPAHRAMTREDLLAGSPEPGAARCHRVPFPLVASLLFAAPAWGAARGALRAWTEITRERRTPDGRPALEDGTHQQVLARSAAEIDAAGLLLEAAAGRADRAADPGADPAAQVPLNLRDCAVAIDLLVTAVERLYRGAGVRGQDEDGDLQRFWRDVHAVAGHGSVQLAPAAAAYAQQVTAAAAR
ncbi:acyl-CoA dehydrogenase family protein [Streptomyces sp. NBC_01298]|uniref:acyl-CoA dehydrogenase family protein n=1 Tax=Streptomyces sp. NBC_01298 TaxID=2903817 RepID=UPI002E116B31|nr:acyl-CoA dehydrogenase family protein [Streptomyces sp. NBC_01298]